MSSNQKSIVVAYLCMSVVFCVLLDRAASLNWSAQVGIGVKFVFDSLMVSQSGETPDHIEGSELRYRKSFVLLGEGWNY